jgi:hypothetical protein
VTTFLIREPWQGASMMLERNSAGMKCASEFLNGYSAKMTEAIYTVQKSILKRLYRKAANPLPVFTNTFNDALDNSK